MISIKLLSRVLNVEVVKINGFLPRNNKNLLAYIVNEKRNDGKRLINIYELMAECKKWAYKQGSQYVLRSCDDAGISGIADFKNQNSNKLSNYIAVYSHMDRLNAKLCFQEKTEIKAVIQACEYILEELEL